MNSASLKGARLYLFLRIELEERALELEGQVKVSMI